MYPIPKELQKAANSKALRNPSGIIRIFFRNRRTPEGRCQLRSSGFGGLVSR